MGDAQYFNYGLAYNYRKKKKINCNTFTFSKRVENIVFQCVKVLHGPQKNLGLTYFNGWIRFKVRVGGLNFLLS